MALSMTEKKAARAEQTEWPEWLALEFQRERDNPNGCVGNQLLSETDRVRVWSIRLEPGERFGFHDLENIGDADLVFSTVEFLEGANKRLAIPKAVRFATGKPA